MKAFYSSLTTLVFIALGPMSSLSRAGPAIIDGGKCTRVGKEQLECCGDDKRPLILTRCDGLRS